MSMVNKTNSLNLERVNDEYDEFEMAIMPATVLEEPIFDNDDTSPAPMETTIPDFSNDFRVSKDYYSHQPMKQKQMMR